MQKFAIVLIVSAPVVARAHAMLERASPPVGSVVHAAPAELALDFSEGVEPRFSTFAVTDAGGAAVNAGGVHTGADARHVLVPVAKLGAGTYTVVWHVVSVDTHKTQGTYRFTVAP